MTRRVSPALTDAAIASAASDAVLMGSISGNIDNFAVVSAAAGKTGGGTLKLRKALNLFAT